MNSPLRPVLCVLLALPLAVESAAAWREMTSVGPSTTSTVMNTSSSAPRAVAHVSSSQAPAPPASVVPVPRTEDWATHRQDEVLKRVRDAKQPVPVVFIGDSITQGWEGDGVQIWKERIAPLGAMNLGVSGDRTEHVLWRLQQAPLTALQPGVVVIMIGTNNAGGGAQPDAIVQGVRAVVSTVLAQCPNTTVMLLDIFPRGEGFNEMRGRNAQVNQTLARTEAFGADAQRVRWTPIGGTFIENDGSITKAIMPDALHLSAEGYARWERAIRDELARLAKARGTARAPSTAPVPAPAGSATSPPSSPPARSPTAPPTEPRAPGK